MACQGKRTRIKNFGITVQSADAYEEPALTEYLRLDSGFIAQATPEQIARDIIKGSYTPEVDLTGILVATMTGVSEMYGADYTDGTTKPWFDNLFRAIQLVSTKIEAIPVNAIPAQFVHNEIVSGATGVGRVIVPTKSTDTVIYIEVTTGGFGAETITGSIAGSATATGVEVDAGWSYKFDTDNCERLSCRSEEDGLISKMYNSVPTLTISSDAGNIAKINYEISGVIHEDAGVDQWMRDGVMSTPVRSEVLPPKFVDGRVKIGDYEPVIDSTLTIDPAITKTLRTDANNSNGAEGYILTGRNGTITERIDTPDNADLDFIADWFNNSAVANEFRFGTNVGNTFWFFAPTARYQNITPTDQDGETKQELQLSLTGQGDQELEIVCI